MSGPYPGAGPPPGYYRRRRGSVVWPLILIAAGVIFLLQNFGLLSWDVWTAIGRLWPLLLVLIGIELFLGGSARGLFGAVVVVCVVLAVLVILAGSAYSHWRPWGPPSGPFTSHTSTQSLQGADSASVSVNFGAGTFNIGPLQSQADLLAQMTYQGPDQLTPTPSYQVRGSQGQLKYTIPGSPRFGPPFAREGGGGGQLDLLLTPNVPLTLDVQEGASSGRIDLGQLRVTGLTLQTGASRTSIILPQNAGATTATIKGGAANIDVEVPQGVAAQIRYEGGLSNLAVDQSRFPSSGERTYKSDGYDAAQNKIDLTIQAGVATISVR